MGVEPKRIYVDHGLTGTNRRYLTQRFRGIDDHNPAARINAFDFHKVANYLNNPQVQQALAHALALP